MRNCRAYDEQRAAHDIVNGGLLAAREARLNYVTDARAGIRRTGGAGRFRYVDKTGAVLRDKPTLERIRALVIPPAWIDVWICPSEAGHIQATGRDSKGRKQYRYHARWRKVRDGSKYQQLNDFVRVLPRIRKAVRSHLSLPGLDQEKVLAAVVRLLETTLIGVGNQKYAKDNGSFGLTTLRNRHVKIRGQHLQFDFRGKSGKQHHIELSDAKLAAIIRRCRDLPGQELFQYLDGQGMRRVVTSTDVNEYLSIISGGNPYTAKDFRTWAGTILAAIALQQRPVPRSERRFKKDIAETVLLVSQLLGNTPAICRKCYVHPGVIDAHRSGQLSRLRVKCQSGLTPLQLIRRNELAVVQMLERRGGRKMEFR